ncbi:MAG: hypothetical protein MUF49_30640, partial [Oculatellaceae cyanobacterium Prado106]|nr:hypothetical protein [Oculatellaceae cyanobacterium Prado106]
NPYACQLSDFLKILPEGKGSIPILNSSDFALANPDIFGEQIGQKSCFKRIRACDHNHVET